MDDRRREPGVLIGPGKALREGHTGGQPERNSAETVSSIGVSTMPGAMVLTRMPS